MLNIDQKKVQRQNHMVTNKARPCFGFYDSILCSNNSAWNNSFRVSSSGQNLRVRLKCAWSVWCQRKQSYWRKWLNMERGGSGKGLARALDLIFSLFLLPGVLELPKFFCYHKGCIHLNWKKVCEHNAKKKKKKRKTLGLIAKTRREALVSSTATLG